MNFEQKRQAMLQKIKRMKEEKCGFRVSSDYMSDVDGGEPAGEKNKKKLVFFGAKTSFAEIAVKKLEETCIVYSFDDGESATNFCIENSIKNVVLDMDAPTDWCEATDVFTAVKTSTPEAKFLLCTKDNESSHVRTIEASGGTIINKLLPLKELENFLKECC